MDGVAEISWWQLAIAVVGLLISCFGVYWLWTNLSFWRHDERASGVVTDLHSGREIQIGGMDVRVQGQNLWYPVLQFTTHDGRDVETTARTGAQPMPARPGDEVTVVYDPDDPNYAELTIWYRLTLALTLLALGLVSFLFVPGLLDSSVGSRLFIAGILSGLGLPFTFLGGTTLWMALRVKRIGYSVFGGLFFGIGLLLWGIFGFVLFAFGG